MTNKKASSEVFLCGVAVVLALNSSCGSNSGPAPSFVPPLGGICPVLGYKGCPNDTPARSTDVDTCNADAADPVCGQQYMDFVTCAAAHGVCTSSGHYDPSSAHTACATQESTWNFCKAGGMVDGGPGGCGMLNIGLTPACETCLSTNCCSAKTTCANNFDCVSLVSCLALCGGDPALCSTCTQALPNGVTDAAGLCNAAGQPCQVDCAF